MVINDEVIKRFFEDKCSPAEADAVIAFIDEHPDATEKFIGETDWNEFKSSLTLHPAVTKKMFSVISNATYSNSSNKKWLRYVAAACALTFVVLGIKYFTTGNSINDNKLATEVIKKATQSLKIVTNNTKKTKQILLNDNSVVMLEPASELSYYEPFENNKRRLYLKGEAFFKVAKDKTKPFTVFSGDINTTALGTAFRVSAFEKSATINVKLLEGKIVISTTNLANKNWKNDFYLLPGDEFNYNKKSWVVSVTTPSKSGKNVNATTKTTSDSPENWFMFNNQNLADVFEELSAIYGTKITYNTSDIANMSFIGRITKQDSILTVLNDIALLNNLIVTKTNYGYSVKKK